MNSRTIHVRLDDDIILSILDTVNDDSKPLSAQFSTFCGIMISELRDAEIIGQPTEDASEVLDTRLKVLGKVDLGDFRKNLRTRIDASERALTQPSPESYEIPDDGNPPVKEVLLDVENVDRMEWSSLADKYPLDVLIQEAHDDEVLQLTVCIVYETLDVSNYGGDIARRLVREMFPKVAEWAKVNAIRRIDDD